MNKDTRENMLGVVPWDSEKGDTSMWRYPKNKCKGVLHVSCFAYGENAFHGKGIYAVDAVTWLSYVRVPFNMKRLDVVPVLAPGSEALSLFGYGSDGAMVSSTILCALVALVLYAVDIGHRGTNVRHHRGGIEWRQCPICQACQWHGEVGREHGHFQCHQQDQPIHG